MTSCKFNLRIDNLSLVIMRVSLEPRPVDAEEETGVL